MRILVVGDIVGKVGRELVKKYLHKVVAKYMVDFVIVNVDNAAHGTGVTEEIVRDMYNEGVDVMTGGNHIVDKQDIFDFLSRTNRLLRPINYNRKTPGKGYHEYILKDSRKILVIHAMGQVFMPQTLDSPFYIIDDLLVNYRLGVDVNAIVLDFHAEATSEKYAMGHFLDGRVSGVFGTHTHIPTNDAHIMEKGTAFMCDIGMNCDFNSVIGTDKRITVENFLKQFRYRRMEQVSGEGTFCAVFLETDDKTGLAKTVENIKIGGVLERNKK